MTDVFQKLKTKFGNVFQFWFSSTRLIVIRSFEDAHHVFAHRYIYEQSDIFGKKLHLVNPSEVIGLTG